jgi:hypothetical protein
MVEELLQATPPMAGETSLPPLLKAYIALSLVLANLTIDLAI